MFGDTPVMVTFFISSSVCRHCKTTYDVFGVLLLNLRKYAYQTRFLFYQPRGLSAFLSQVSKLLLDLAFSHAWKIMFDPSFLICNVCFNMCMHNLYHSLYRYATSFFFLKQNRFTSSVSLILISVHYDYVCRSCCKCANKAMIKVIMFILFCYFYDYNYQCS